MAYIFQTVAQKGNAQGISPNKTAEARDWYRSAAKAVASANPTRLLNDPSNNVPSITIKDIGKMFMFFYDPKHKDTLPYYDIFPLIFVVDFKPNGFMGLNLHYLPPHLRARLMDELYDLVSNDKYDGTTKLKLSYRILQSASVHFQPCLKRYLWSHVGSQFLNVEPQNWDTALMLPTERFKKASKETVFKNSKKMVG